MHLVLFSEGPSPATSSTAHGNRPAPHGHPRGGTPGTLRCMTVRFFRKNLKGFGAAVGDEIDRLRARIASYSGMKQPGLKPPLKPAGSAIDEKRRTRGDLSQVIERNRMALDEYSRQIDDITLGNATRLSLHSIPLRSRCRPAAGTWQRSKYS